jgi:hypothetical protein
MSSQAGHGILQYGAFVGIFRDTAIRSGLTSRPIVFSFRSMIEDDGQMHTLGLLEQLRDQCKSLWGTSSELYFRVDKLLQQLANPNLHDIPTNLSFHVELWDRFDQHIRWVIAATSSVAIANAAFDVAVATHQNERLMLRQGIRVVRKHGPGDTE